MMWQDLVFMVGSGLSIVFLAPTLRDASARVPLGTSLPSMAIGLVYAATFFTLGMTFSAAGTMWALIALVRSPASPALIHNTDPSLLARDARLWLDRLGSSDAPVDQYAFDGGRGSGYSPADD